MLCIFFLIYNILLNTIFPFRLDRLLPGKMNLIYLHCILVPVVNSQEALENSSRQTGISRFVDVVFELQQDFAAFICESNYQEGMYGDISMIFSNSKKLKNNLFPRNLMLNVLDTLINDLF